MGRYRKQAFKNVRPYWDTNSIRYEFTQNKSSAAHSRSLWYLMFFFYFRSAERVFLLGIAIAYDSKVFSREKFEKEFLGGRGEGRGSG